MGYLHVLLILCLKKKNFPHDNYLVGHILDYVYEKLSNNTNSMVIYHYHQVQVKGNKTQLKKLVNIYGFIEFWDTSAVTSLENAFNGLCDFNYAISRWNVKNVTNMHSTFKCTKNFCADIGNWDVSNVSMLRSTFEGTENFCADISDWDVSNVKDMSNIFWGSEKFNVDVSRWDISNVQNLSCAF